jgi:DNA-binding transcriptional regulator LsrR (DeoR family)
VYPTLAGPQPTKRVIAWRLAEAMKSKSVTRTEMAARMHTSRMVVNRLLDANDTSAALGIQLRLELCS